MRKSFSILSFLALCGTALAAGPALRFTLLTPGQPPVAISLLSIAADAGGVPTTITYLDPAASERTIALKDIIALAPAAWVPTPETTAPVTDGFTSDLPIHRLDLTDGQRFVGEFPGGRPGVGPRPSPPSPPGTAPSADAPVMFQCERLGLLTVPLDRVQRYHYSAKYPPEIGSQALSTVNDTLFLGNSDRIEGLVTRLGPGVVTIETKPTSTKPGTAARPMLTTIDIRQVLLAHLVNPGAPLRSLRVDLNDGTVLAADRLSADAQGSRLVVRAVVAGASSQTVAMDLGHLAAVIPDASRIIPISGLPFAAQTPAPGRVSTLPAAVVPDVGAPLSAADILLPGPMTVEWAIPAGAASVLGYAQMDDRSFAWGDCVVSVSIAAPAPGAPERQIAKGRLNSESPSLTIASPLGTLRTGDRLRVRVDSGERGPIQDRTVLRRMVFLTAPVAN